MNYISGSISTTCPGILNNKQDKGKGEAEACCKSIVCVQIFSPQDSLISPFKTL